MTSRARRKGVYAPLAGQYYLDDAILEAGPDAELLWVRILSFLATVPSDGFITDNQLKAVGYGLRSVPNRVKKLQEVGILTAETGGFVARSWLKWNKSAQEYGRELAKDRERKAPNSGREGKVSDRNPAGIPSDSSPQSSTEQIQSRADKYISSEVATATTRPDVESLLDLLDDEIRRNGSKVPSRSKANRDAMRLLLDRDGHTAEQVSRAIRWCQADGFWRSNILSAVKLREKYDQLRLAAQRPQGQSAATADHGRSVHDELLARRAAAGLEINA